MNSQELIKVRTQSVSQKCLTDGKHLREEISVHGNADLSGWRRVLDPVIAMNLLFDVVIILLGSYAYGKKRVALLLWITLGFSLFAVSYVLTILGFGSSVLIPLRAVGYLSIIVGLVHYIKQR